MVAATAGAANEVPDTGWPPKLPALLRQQVAVPWLLALGLAGRGAEAIDGPAVSGSDAALLKRLEAFRKAQTDSVAETVEDGK